MVTLIGARVGMTPLDGFDTTRAGEWDSQTWRQVALRLQETVDRLHRAPATASEAQINSFWAGKLAYLVTAFCGGDDAGRAAVAADLFVPFSSALVADYLTATIEFDMIGKALVHKKAVKVTLGEIKSSSGGARSICVLLRSSVGLLPLGSLALRGPASSS